MKNIIKETTGLLLHGVLKKEEADEILFDLLVVGVPSEQLVCTYCGINPLKETCQKPKRCSSKRKIPSN